jgi:hypothetical protein
MIRPGAIVLAEIEVAGLLLPFAKGPLADKLEPAVGAGTIAGTVEDVSAVAAAAAAAASFLGLPLFFGGGFSLPLVEVVAAA